MHPPSNLESPLSISNEFPSPRPGYLFDSFLAVPVLHLRLRDRSLVRVCVLCTITVHFYLKYILAVFRETNMLFD